MDFLFYREARDFTAGDAAKISGVSPVLQRDWRRRGLLEDANSRAWVRYSLMDVCILALMKAFSDGGIGVKSALTLAKFTVHAAPTFMEMLPGAVAFSGEELSDEEKDQFLKEEWARYLSARFVFAPLPDRDPTDDLANAYTFESLSEIEKRVGDGWFYGLVFDLKALAKELHARAPLPLVTYRVVKEGEE